MKLDRQEFVQWEREILEQFNDNNCLEDLTEIISTPFRNDFLHNLADSLFSFKIKIQNKINKNKKENDNRK